MRFWIAGEGGLQRAASLPAGMVLWSQARPERLRVQLGAMHQSLRRWAELRLSPGPIVPARVHVGDQGQLAFSADDDGEPGRLLVNVGSSPDLAGWLVLLDKRLETESVLQTARSVWSTAEMAGALPFVTPAFLPRELVATLPDNWLRVARGLAALVAEPVLHPHV